jgi:hypothetical protein
MAERHQSLDHQIRFAIENKRLIEVTYDGKRRTVEPHDYGVLKGVEKVLIYQLRPVSPPSSNRQGSRWRTFDVAKVLAAVVLEQSFPGSRGRADQKHLTWDVLYVRVSP